MSDKWKRAVRDRMAVTGEGYTRARKALLYEKAVAGDELALADLQRCDERLYQDAIARRKP